MMNYIKAVRHLSVFQCLLKIVRQRDLILTLEALSSVPLIIYWLLFNEIVSDSMDNYHGDSNTT